MSKFSSPGRSVCGDGLPSSSRPHRIGRRRFVSGCAALAVGLLSIGCEKKAPSGGATVSTVQAPAEPSQIELAEPIAYYQDPETIRFEVKYRFTKGAPKNFYLAEVRFEGTDVATMKYIEGWELQDSGVIRDGIILQAPNAALKDFEVVVSEAMVPQDGYKPISNKVRGQLTAEKPVANPAEGGEAAAAPAAKE